MKILLSSVALLISLLISTATAGTVTGAVAYVMQRTDGLTYVTVVGTPVGKPACASVGYWMIKDENSEPGKRQYAMLLLAKASGLRLVITGSNTCTRWGDGEDIAAIQLID